jgi:hypothetical protein
MNNFYLGKDKTNKWRKESIQTHSWNITSHLPGIKRRMKDATSPTDCWKYLFTEEMHEVVVEHANKYIDSNKKLYSRESAAKLTSKCEVKSPD